MSNVLWKHSTQSIVRAKRMAFERVLECRGRVEIEISWIERVPADASIGNVGCPARESEDKRRSLRGCV